MNYATSLRRRRSPSTWMGPVSGLAVRRWLHILASTVWLAFYRTSPKRGSLLAKVTGIVIVHDPLEGLITR